MRGPIYSWVKDDNLVLLEMWPGIDRYLLRMTVKVRGRPDWPWALKRSKAFKTEAEALEVWNELTGEHLTPTGRGIR